jgi:hypothetical protein
MSTKPANEARAEIDLDLLRQLLFRVTRETATVNDATQLGLYLRAHAERLLSALSAQPHPAGDAIMALSEMRAKGWTVAVHNDYRLDGQPMTFWLFTHEASERFVKGEGPTDWAAVKQALAAARRLLDAPPGVGERMREALNEIAKMPLQYFPDASYQMQRIARAALAAPAPAEPERAKAGEWISVKERLPEPDVDYLWHVASGSCPVQIGSLNRHKDIVFTERGYYSIREVFNWQPLPDPPAPAASSAAEGSVATGEGGR